MISSRKPLDHASKPQILAQLPGYLEYAYDMILELEHCSLIKLSTSRASWHAMVCMMDCHPVSTPLVTDASVHVPLGSLFTPHLSVLSFPLQGFWCWPDLVDRPVGRTYVNQHLLHSIVFIIILSSQMHALSIVTCYCKRLRCTTLLQP